MNESVSILGAFAGGLLSFLSPCVLPIVPGYLSFISGVNLSQYRENAAPKALTLRVVATATAFVLGFSTVFVALGAAASLIVGALLAHYKREFSIVGGVIILILGIHMTGLVRIPWLLAERRAGVRTRPLGLLGAYVVGLAFAFGWTPCIGPILGAILVYASQRETVMEGIVLLSAYSAGLGLPFLAAAVAINAFFAAFSRIRHHMHKVEVVSGILLVLVGLLLVTNQLTVLSRWFSRLFPSLTRLG
jgi:cytochrome c-type biogenesis protein